MLDVACVARPIFNDIENQTTLAPGQIFGHPVGIPPQTFRASRLDGHADAL